MKRLLSFPAAVLGVFLAGLAAAQACEPGAEVEPHRPSGVLVDRVVPGGNAEAVGILEGDIILSINDLPINSQEDLDRAFAPCPPEMDIVLKRRVVPRDAPVEAKTASFQTLRIHRKLPAKRPKK